MCFTAPNGPSMYLDFENATSSNSVEDESGNGNDAVLLKGAKLSSRKLGGSNFNSLENIKEKPRKMQNR